MLFVNRSRPWTSMRSELLLHMVPEHELQGIGIKVGLLVEVLDIVLADIVLQEGYWDDEWHQFPVVVRDHVLQFLLFIFRELVFEVPGHVLLSLIHISEPTRL